MKICGVDEAGRGCIIGPLVMCGAVFAEEDLSRLQELGVTDSKLLKPAIREALFEQIKKIAKSYKIIHSLPEEIDASVGTAVNLNWLEGNKTCAILNALDFDRAILDCPSPNTRAYKEYVEHKLEHKCELVVEHKADLKYVAVGAASILAKVERDRAIGALKVRIGVEFGSGYCSDPTTAKFLSEHWATFPEIFRHSWSPYQEVRFKKAQKPLTDFR